MKALSKKVHSTANIVLLNYYKYYCTEPTMKHLHQLVIPNIAAEWKTVADYLEFTLPLIKIIEEKCRDDPVKCCTELFRQWLSSDYGVGPKTWSTLIVALKEIKQLATVTKEIEHKLNCK